MWRLWPLQGILSKDSAETVKYQGIFEWFAVLHNIPSSFCDSCTAPTEWGVTSGQSIYVSLNCGQQPRTLPLIDLALLQCQPLSSQRALQKSPLIWHPIFLRTNSSHSPPSKPGSPPCSIPSRLRPKNPKHSTPILISYEKSTFNPLTSLAALELASSSSKQKCPMMRARNFRDQYSSAEAA